MSVVKYIWTSRKNSISLTFNKKKKPLGLGQYAVTKLCQIYFSQLFYQKTNIMTVSLHPGVVNTEIIIKIANKFILLKLLIFLLYPFLWFMMKTPKMGAQTSLYCCLEDNLKLVGGGYYVDCKIG